GGDERGGGFGVADEDHRPPVRARVGGELLGGRARRDRLDEEVVRVVGLRDLVLVDGGAEARWLRALAAHVAAGEELECPPQVVWLRHRRAAGGARASRARRCRGGRRAKSSSR